MFNCKKVFGPENLGVTSTLLLLCLFGVPKIAASQDTTPSDSPPPETTDVKTTVFNSTEFNPYYIGLGNWPRKINIGLYAQFRYEANWANTDTGMGDDVTHDFHLNRARFFVEGRFLDRLRYHLAVNHGVDDSFSLQQAFLKFHFESGWRIWVGQQFYNSLREDWPDPTQTASMDNSAMDYTFGLGTSLGATIQSKQKEKTRWTYTINNSSIGSRSASTNSNNSDITLYARMDYQPKGGDWSVWDDLIGGVGFPKQIMFGFYGGYMKNGTKNTGGVEDAVQFGADLNFNGDGYQIVLAGVMMKRWEPNAGSYYEYGAYFQAAYFFRPKWQAYARYDYVSPGNSGAGLESYRAPGIGVNYFPIVNRRWRISAELNNLNSAINNTIVVPVPELGWQPSDVHGQTNLRIQVQLGF